MNETKTARAAKTEKKKIFTKMNEIAWVLGIVFCALGVCLCTKSGLGLSMIAAAPYILHKYLIEFLPWFTQGVAEYVWQGFLLIVMCIAVGRFRAKYLLSFATAVLAGLAIDGWFIVLGGSGVYEAFPMRAAMFVVGIVITAAAVAFIFRTTLPVQIYELTVCEISDRYSLDRNKVKMASDIAMLVIGAILALTLLGGWYGVTWGTLFITAVNAPLIAFFGKIYDRFFEYGSLFPKITDKLK